MDKYVTKLRTLVLTCEFGNLRDSMIRDRLVLGVRNGHIQACLLRTTGLTLVKALELCPAVEASERQLKSLQPAEEPVRALSQQSPGTETGARLPAVNPHSKPNFAKRLS